MRRPIALCIVPFVLVTLAASCGEDSTGSERGSSMQDAGTEGAAAQGGSWGDASAGSGGTGGQGGTAGAGGSAGGSAGSGGVAGAGGIAGGGGVAGSAGAAGAAGGSGPLAALFAGQAHFEPDQDPVPIQDPSSGHREAFAVNRTDVSANTVFLYHRCFGFTGDASICLSISHDGADTFAEFKGEVMAPAAGHIFAVAPVVFESNGTWNMVWEESNVASLYWGTSSDGIQWTSHGELLPHGSNGAWDQGALATPGAVVDGAGTVYVFYAGFPLGGNQMNIGFAFGPSLASLSKATPNPVFAPDPGAWDGGQVSMPRLIQEGAWTYMVYEGADTDFTCEPYNRYGWGLARTQDSVTWERYAGNPIGQSSQSPFGCGNDMPSVFRRSSDGVVFVYHTSADTKRIVREHLVVD